MHHRDDGIILTPWRKSIRLTGTVETHADKIDAGFAAVGKGYKGVINDITARENESKIPCKMHSSDYSDKLLEGKQFDAVVIGGGIIGASILRELTRYKIKAVLLEKESDLAKHTSGRNDGMIHAGFAAQPGSKKALYNVRGNKAYTKITADLKVPFYRPGSILLYSNPAIRLFTPLLKARADKNGVPGCRYLSNREIRVMNPYITDNIHGGFFMPTAGQLSPCYLTIAMAENAVENGAQIFFNTVVTGMKMKKNKIIGVETNRGIVSAGVVINAAGVWADKIASFADDRFFSLHFRKGTEAILDVKTRKYLNTIIGMPQFINLGSHSKGGGLVPTIEGNILVGPTAVEQFYREDYTTDSKNLVELQKHINLVENIGREDIITYFSGIRACSFEEDFIVEASEYVDNLVHAAGIQSPGLASAPAIAEDISRISINILSRENPVVKNEKFNPVRKALPQMNLLSEKERDKWIKKDPAFGRIICRCEEISEGEVRNALRSPVPAVTLDGIKRRARAGAGRCNGGFCTPRILEIMAREMNIDLAEITGKGPGSRILTGKTKGSIDYSGFKLKTDRDKAVN